MEKVKKVDRKGKKMRYKCIEMDRKTQKERVGREQYWEKKEWKEEDWIKKINKTNQWVSREKGKL